MSEIIIVFKRIFFAALAFLGWVLSPFTWWNDTFVNLPLAYILANISNKFFRSDFLSAFLISYWLTNFLGIALMYIGAEGLAVKGVIKKRKGLILITIIIYSIISAILIGFKIIRPF